MIFGILLLICLLSCFIYIWRDSAGHPGLWMRAKCSHSNPTIQPFYIPYQAREKMLDDMARMRAERDAKKKGMLEDNEEPLMGVVPPETPIGDAPGEGDALMSRSADAEAGSHSFLGVPGTSYEGPDEDKPPSAPEGDGEEEPPHERARRLEWIKFYVRTGQPEEA